MNTQTMKARVLKKPPFVCALVRPFSGSSGYLREFFPQIVTQRQFLSGDCIEPILVIEADTARDAWRAFLGHTHVRAAIKGLEREGYRFTDTMHN